MRDPKHTQRDASSFAGVSECSEFDGRMDLARNEQPTAPSGQSAEGCRGGINTSKAAIQSVPATNIASGYPMTATTKAAPGILAKARLCNFRNLDEANIEAVKNKRCSGCKCRQLKRCTADESIVGPIMPLATIEPEGLNPIGNHGWEEIEVAVDSGATENVMSPDTLVSVPITSGPAS